MSKIEIPASIAEELFEIEDEDLTEDGKYRRITDQPSSFLGRWRRGHLLVFQVVGDDHRYFAYEYGEGLTEYQDHEYPWRSSTEYIKVREVVPRQKTITIYRKI